MKASEIPGLISTVGSYYVCKEISLFEKFSATVFTLFYFLSPVDLIPDVIPVVGWLDDIGIGALLLAYCAWRVKNVKSEKTQELEVIETTAEVVPPVEEKAPEPLLAVPKDRTPKNDLFSAKR